MAIFLNGQLVAGAAMVNADGEQLATKDDLKGLNELATSSSDKDKALIIDENGKITLSSNTIDNMGGGSGNSSNYVTKVMNATEGNIAVLNSDGSLADGEVSIDNIIPHIGENNHWYIGTEDTGVVAKGEDGQSPVVTATKSGKVTTIKVNETSIAEINDGATGPRGPQGEQGMQGESITITNTTESQEDGGSNIITFSNGTNITIKNGKTGLQGPVGATGAPGISMAQFKALNLVNGKVINEECYVEWEQLKLNTAVTVTLSSKQKFSTIDNSDKKYKITKATATVYDVSGATEEPYDDVQWILNKSVFTDPGEPFGNTPYQLQYNPDTKFMKFYLNFPDTGDNTLGFTIDLSDDFDTMPITNYTLKNIKLYIDPIDFGDFVIYEEVNQ